MRTPEPLPDSLHSELFTVRSALAAGVGAERLRRSDLEAPFPGVRVPAKDALSLHERCLAYQVLRPDTLVSHHTAATLHGLPAPWPRGDRLDMAVIAPARAPRGSRIRGHRLDPRLTRVRVARGARVASALSVWLQLAGTQSMWDLVVVGDALLRRKRPLATAAALTEAVEAHHGRRGHRTLTRAARLVRAGTDSPRETRLRLSLLAAGLPEPEVNKELFDDRGRFLARADLVYRAERVIVEYDGDHHRTDRRQYERDIDRLNALAEAGWLVIRVNRSHGGTRLSSVIEQVGRALRSRGRRPGDAAGRPALPRSVG
ncbi:DUF559 domain-containing protein [Ruania suaedae]|uniref:endonuclease domain-containing protein n=1 Tax=Ruania suaedae TaxID=2897774 RepID=UPI001E3693C6|nr:DUF559 domain-containing protein [Ruania suaedae]UFU03814.1 DUF559 domain-containing protein [Ruania suaedae]